MDCPEKNKKSNHCITCIKSVPTSQFKKTKPVCVRCRGHNSCSVPVLDLAFRHDVIIASVSFPMSTTKKEIFRPHDCLREGFSDKLHKEKIRYARI